MKKTLIVIAIIFGIIFVGSFLFLISASMIQMALQNWQQVICELHGQSYTYCFDQSNGLLFPFTN
jgi:hypothetical protein